MDYTEFLEEYPIANAYLVKLATERITKAPDFLEREIRAQIAQTNKRIDQVLLQAVPDGTKIYLREDLVRYCRHHSVDYQLLEEEKKSLLSQLSTAKKSATSQPTTSQLITASAQVKDYFQELLLKGSAEALLRWNSVLSNQEKYFLANTYKFSETKGITNWRYCDENSYIPAWEPVIETIKLDDQVIAYITENSYGVKCLNAPSVMFVDIDTDSEAEDLPLSCLPFDKWHWNVQMSFEIINQVCLDNPELLFAVYRTRNGLRLLELANTWRADSSEAINILSALGSDPLFKSLCKRQGTFRARLEVKPWRQNDSINQVVCKYLFTAGHGRQNLTALAIQRLHDSWCLGHGELA